MCYFEFVAGEKAALAREKQIKGWSRKKKIDLIQKENPNWIDLNLRWTEALRVE